jgi:hypothetical protein
MVIMHKGCFLELLIEKLNAYKSLFSYSIFYQLALTASLENLWVANSIGHLGQTG